jgi:molybdate transport system substrate-binding protein
VRAPSPRGESGGTGRLGGAVRAHGRRSGWPLRTAVLASAAAGTLLLSGCADTSNRTGASETADGKVLTVYAAASLAEPFTELARSFEAAEPGSSVRLNFAGSSELATQILEGAPADVFAAADTATMKRVDGAGELDGGPRDFASNVPALVVPAGNPAGITGLADLEDDGAAVVVCAEQVPCGAAGRRLAAANSVTLRPVSEESSVTAVLAKVRAGEADAGLVYRTDAVRAAGEVESIPVEHADRAAVTYPIAVTRSAGASERSALAEDFVEYVAGATGQDVLAQAGFGKP